MNEGVKPLCFTLLQLLSAFIRVNPWPNKPLAPTHGPWFNTRQEAGVPKQQPG
jgi:hypothetical protein